MSNRPAANRRHRPDTARRFAAAAITAAAVVGFLCLARAGEKTPAGPSAVLFIGDGMGPAYVTTTRIALGGSNHRLRMDALPYTAISRTHAADMPVTDSAAAATAMACGVKTVNGVLGEDATAIYGKRDGRKLESVALWARKRGVRVGVVTTTTVTHATPAAFYAQNRDRDDEAGIAVQAIASGFDLILGGGQKFFPPELRTRAQTEGWEIVETAGALRGVRGLRRHVLGLFARGHCPYEAEIEAARAAAGGGPGRGGVQGPAGSVGENPAASTAPTLLEMTRFAVDALKGTGQPFFLMVEGGRIDHAGHANWARTLVDETAEFDAAIGYAVDTLDPKTTLVLVTADHETGGLALNGYPTEKDGLWSTYAEPDAPKDDHPYPVLTFSSGPGTKRQTDPPPHGQDDPRPSGISLGDAAHTGVDVHLYAWGAGARAVHGTLENTAVYELLKSHLEGRPAHP